MKRVWKRLQLGRAAVASHPFFEWINSEDSPLERRFVFSPVMVDFIMGFSDMNKWFLSYEEPRNQLERAINQHTLEDRTHSRLFQDNWYTLDLDSVATWPPGKMLWWMFHSSDSIVVRSFGMKILDLAVSFPDPLVRFPMMEAIEICGDVFFGNTAPLAQRLAAKHGVPHVYFGEYHRARETGHLHADETEFVVARLTDAQVRDATRCVDCVIENFRQLLDEILSFARRMNENAVEFSDALEAEYRNRLAPPSAEPSSAKGTPATARVAADGPAQQLLAARMQRLQGHAFLRWLETDDMLTPRQKLQSFIALWGIDIVGYKDFNDLVLTYPESSSEAQKQINRWAANLAAHGVLYLQDWRALGMDALLSWDAGETIAFYFLSEETELHRRNMARVKHYAFRYKSPYVRWWLMNALESALSVLLNCTRGIAMVVERETHVRLNYWTDRRWLTHAHGAVTEQSLGEPVPCSDETSIVCDIISEIFDNFESQFSLSHSAAIDVLFLKRPETLPPPRTSSIVELQPTSQQMIVKPRAS